MSGRRRLIPMLVGLGCGGLVAVTVVLVAPRSATSQPPSPDSSTRPESIAVGPLPQHDASSAPMPPGPLLLPLPTPLPVPPPAPTPPPPPKHAKPATPGLSGPAAQVVALTNARRAAAGCKPLKVDPRLNRSAQRHSEDMAGEGYFSHTDPDGGGFADRERAAGYRATGGENIARGYSSAAQVMKIWMNSPPHRENILRCSFTTIGVGYVAKGNYWTQNFGY